jgi:hypothetical protein
MGADCRRNLFGKLEAHRPEVENFDYRCTDAVFCCRLRSCGISVYEPANLEFGV